jgi:DedD protein
MAQPTTNEELQLRKRARRRLIGATVLVMVVVLGLPMVLDTEPKPARQDVDIRIPSPDSGTFKSKIVPVAPAPDSKATANPPAEAAPRSGSTATRSEDAPKEAPASKSAPRVASTPASKPDPSATERSTKEPSVAEAPKPATRDESAGDAKQIGKRASGSHVVQITALLNAERAKEIHEKVNAAGIKSYTEVVTTAKGDVTRVRAGPFATREEAEKARSQLHALGLDGKVTAR